MPTTDRDTQALTALADAMRDLDYDPMQEAWVCGAHVIPECDQGSCPELPWPEPNDPRFDEFHAWVEERFGRVIRPYDEAKPGTMDIPDEAFDVYCLTDWLASAQDGPR